MVSGVSYTYGSGWASPYSNPLKTIVDQIREQLALLKPLVDNLRPAANGLTLSDGQKQTFIPIANSLYPLYQKLQALEGQVTPDMLSPGEQQAFRDQIRSIIDSLRGVSFYYTQSQSQRLVNSLYLNEIRSLVSGYTKSNDDSLTSVTPPSLAAPSIPNYNPYSSGSSASQPPPSYAAAVPSTPGGFNPYSSGSSASQPPSSYASAGPSTPGGFNPYSNSSNSSGPAAAGSAGGGLLGYDVNGNPIYDPSQAYRIHYAKNAAI